MIKKFTAIALLTLFSLTSLELFADCDERCNDDREERTLFDQNRRRLRRAKSDRYRAFNFSNYQQGETIEEVNEQAQGEKYQHGEFSRSDNYRRTSRYSGKRVKK